VRRPSLLLVVPLSALLFVGCDGPQKGAARGQNNPQEDGGMDGGKNDVGDHDGGKKPVHVQTTKPTCSDLACDKNGTCDDSGGEPRCVCLAGYEGDGKTCKDIDECASHSACNENATCANTEGGFTCTCKEGFEGNGDSCGAVVVDECADPALDTCDPNAKCKDTEGGFTCACNSGFTGDGFGCGDIDECSGKGARDCGDHSTCTNSFGDSGCTCDPGFELDSSDCVSLCANEDCADHVLCSVGEDGAECRTDTCAAGYVGDGTNCTAIVAGDICATCDGQGSDDIDGAVCTGTPGAGTCSCAPGYSGTPDTGCTDDDECDMNKDRCSDSSALCTNLPGGFFCGCAPGYEKNDSGKCVDIDECAADVSPCHPNAKCTNKTPAQNPQGYECKCNSGFTGDGTVCRDINECEDGKDNCLTDGTARCANTNGSFECLCARGYTGDGITSCTNLNECKHADDNDCDKNATCKDRTPEQNPVGYECTCKDGYTGDGMSCKDVDECKNKALYDCPGKASCFNTPGGYDCGCKDPYVADDAGSCYCDLSGYWAMRQDVHTTWNEIKVSNITIISGGELDSTVWELHKYTYDGDVVKVEKKGCGTDIDPDLISPFYNETYASYIPLSVLSTIPLAPGRDISQSGIVPGDMFDGPEEAAVVGIDLGDDPLNAEWPSLRSEINDVGGAVPAWKDEDADGEPGISLWSKLPSQQTQASTSSSRKYYYYLPAKADATLRSACTSSASRIVTTNHYEVEACDRITGTIDNDASKSRGRVHSCLSVDSVVVQGNVPGHNNKDPDMTCTEDDWAAAEAADRCDDAALDVLDDQGASNADQGTAEAAFELVKIGNLGDDINCEEVRAALPAIDR
jgi:hypothetical protein